MGLFDRFKKRQKAEPDTGSTSPTTEELSYGVAYFILPHYSFNDLDKVKELWGETPAAAGPFMYLMACKARGIEPNEGVVHEFRASVREAGSLCFYILAHPNPSPIDFSDKDPIALMESGDSITLAPYYSCILDDAASNRTALYILGQSPIGGGTTLRSISANGMNANLGPGPEPDLDQFINAITPNGD